MTKIYVLIDHYVCSSFDAICYVTELLPLLQKMLAELSLSLGSRRAAARVGASKHLYPL